MEFKLEEVNINMGFKEYLMYQEIPFEENGAYNYAKGLNFHQYKHFLKEKEEEKEVALDEKNTPRISYVFYVNNNPAGEIAIRPVLNEYWKIHSGNIGYKIRPTERGKGYGKIMLSLALEECRKLKMNKVLLQTNETNVASKRVIENNNGRMVKQLENTCFYEINLG